MAKNRKKYIIINGVFPVVFAEAIPHADMRKLGNITSAGFVNITPNGEGIDVLTYGISEGLCMASKPDDAVIIKTILGL